MGTNRTEWTEASRATSAELRAVASLVTAQGRVALAELARREEAEARLVAANRAARS
jgi:hypothetical protein